MIGFLRRIGIEVRLTTLGDEAFLPGLRVDRGRLLVDAERLIYPGDLLHEGGHIALVPPELRPLLGDDVTLPGLDLSRIESAIVPWSYAAALHLDIDPAVVLHDGGYRGHSRGLLATYAVGVYPGVALLQELGLTATPARAAELGVEPYPYMLRWLRDSDGGDGADDQADA